MTDEVVATAVRRKARTGQTGRCAVLYPAIAEAARRAGARAVGLIDVGCRAGPNLGVDRVGITYSNGQSLGDPSSPVQMSCSIVGDRPVPNRAIPEVAARVGVDLDPVDATDADAARWLRACLPPDQPERAARLGAELALAAAAPPPLLRGDAAEVLPGAFARVAAGHVRRERDRSHQQASSRDPLPPARAHRTLAPSSNWADPVPRAPSPGTHATVVR